MGEGLKTAVRLVLHIQQMANKLCSIQSQEIKNSVKKWILPRQQWTDKNRKFEAELQHLARIRRSVNRPAGETEPDNP